MFKLVSLTALIAFSQASSVSADEAKAEADEKNIKEKWAQQVSRANKMESSPSAPIWKYDKKEKYWSFQGASKAQSSYSFEPSYKLNSDTDVECIDCYMSGNKWDIAGQKCNAATQTPTDHQTTYDKTAPAIDRTMTYQGYFEMAQTCYSTPATECKSTYDLTKFDAEPPSGKAAGKAAYTWTYSYDSKSAISDWTVCQYTAQMPHKKNKKGEIEYSFSGGLLLHQVVPADSSVQPVVQINNKIGSSNANVLYNRASLQVLSVGKTNKIVIPYADTIEVVWTNTQTVPAAQVDGFSLTFERKSNSELAVFTIEHGGVIVWVIIGIVVFCLLCVGIIVWKKCFHKEGEAFYVDDAYARV